MNILIYVQYLYEYDDDDYDDDIVYLNKITAKVLKNLTLTDKNADQPKV
jgi:hypothetical protein